MNEARRAVTRDDAVSVTLERLVGEARIARPVAVALAEELAGIRSESLYVLRHLGAHLGIGGLRASLPFLPLGSLLRTAWVASWRIAETLRARRERARVHSLSVLLVAAVPFVGYFAYLIPLRALHPGAAYVYANHVCYLRFGCSLDEAMAPRPLALRRLVARLAPAPADPRAEP